MTGFGVEITRKRGFDRSVTGRSNWGWAFVFNRSGLGGGGEESGESEHREIGTKEGEADEG
jgi:hypothetical protein